MVHKYSVKEYLDLSAIELLSQNNIDRVTVRDICSNCGVSTHTFYKYYRDKYDIINSCYNSALQEFYIEYADELTIHNFLLYTAGIVYDKRNFFINVFRYKGQNNIRVGLTTPLEHEYQRIISERFGIEISESLKKAVSFFVRGQLAYVEEALEWVDIPDAQTSVAYFENAIPAVLLPYLY